MSENDIEKTKQEIVKIDELIVKKQKEMNELRKRQDKAKDRNP